LDTGAVKVIKQDGKSLLPIGVTAVEGDFERGEVVACCDANGVEIARGLVNYSALEAQRIMRKPSSEIEKILGYVDTLELIHRDNMVLV
jgi:glutamate 5-kinase